ncbi:MAG: hypothetical protein ACOYMF_16010 [Bacteroidales bacterium]
MDKIKLKLSKSEWERLMPMIEGKKLFDSWSRDKYIRAVLDPLLRQVYEKMYKKALSLHPIKNTLCLSLPEASVLNLALMRGSTMDYLTVQITGLIDQKLT